MPGFNEVQVARYDGIIRRLLGIRQPESAAQVSAAELLPTLELTSRLEYAYLGRDEVHGIGRVQAAAVATQPAHVGLQMPAASGKFLVILGCTLRFTGNAVEVESRVAREVGGAGYAIGADSAADQRWGDTFNQGISAQTIGSPSVALPAGVGFGPSHRVGGAAGLNSRQVTSEYFPILLEPGNGFFWTISSAPNNATFEATFRWYERSMGPDET